MEYVLGLFQELLRLFSGKKRFFCRPSELADFEAKVGFHKEAQNMAKEAASIMVFLQYFQKFFFEKNLSPANSSFRAEPCEEVGRLTGAT